MTEFKRFWNKCDYCKDETQKKYCCGKCKNRADVLRRAVMNKNKIPKKVDDVDILYTTDYVLWLSGNAE